MKEKTTAPMPTVGFSSLLVIFAVLCLTVFALLTVSTVRGQARLAENARQAVTGYYEAESQAHEILADIRAGLVPEGVTRQGDLYSYGCPISQTQRLQVEVRVTGGEYKIIRWQAVSTVQWQASDSLPVWGGEKQEGST